MSARPWLALAGPEIAEHFVIACEPLGERCTVVRNRHRRGSLANMVTAIRLVCTNPDSVIVTLDADDTLIGERVLERLAVEYEAGADVTVGSMLRTDKATDYTVQFEQPREHRGGNVWQQGRTAAAALSPSCSAEPEEILAERRMRN